MANSMRLDCLLVRQALWLAYSRYFYPLRSVLVQEYLTTRARTGVYIAIFSQQYNGTGNDLTNQARAIQTGMVGMEARLDMFGV